MTKKNDDSKRMTVGVNIDIEPVKGMYCIYTCPDDMLPPLIFNLHIATPKEDIVVDFIDEDHSYGYHSIILDKEGNFWRMA